MHKNNTLLRTTRLVALDVVADAQLLNYFYIVRSNSSLKISVSFQIYNLPDFKLRLLVKNFPVGHKVLVDSGQVTEPSKSAATP